MGSIYIRPLNINKDVNIVGGRGAYLAKHIKDAFFLCKRELWFYVFFVQFFRIKLLWNSRLSFLKCTQIFSHILSIVDVSISKMYLKLRIIKQFKSLLPFVRLFLVFARNFIVPESIRKRTDDFFSQENSTLSCPFKNVQSPQLWVKTLHPFLSRHLSFLFLLFLFVSHFSFSLLPIFPSFP